MKQSIFSLLRRRSVLFASIVLALTLAGVVVYLVGFTADQNQSRDQDAASNESSQKEQSNKSLPESNENTDADEGAVNDNDAKDGTSSVTGSSDAEKTKTGNGASDSNGGSQTSAQNTTPSPSPPTGGGGVVCNGQTHVAGGSDGSGGCWPGSSNTGVPSGTVLSAYSGPTTFSSGSTTIDGKLINDDLVVTGTGHLTVKNSKMVGHFDADTANGTLTIIDSEIDGTSWVGATVGFQNVTILRSNIYGSQHSVLCGDNCSVRDSWLHDQYEHNGDHNNAYISNGGNNVELVHNTLHCTPIGGVGGGCSSDASFFGDFAAITNVTIDGNLLLFTPSGGYCAYLGHDPGKPFGSSPSNVKVTNNYFQKGSSGKCGSNAAVTSFLNANGNVFTNNKFTDGATVAY